jgi:hypothetical protein
MQRHGVPRSQVDCLFSTLQYTMHQVCPGYGDSEKFYGGKFWMISMHGIGQAMEQAPLYGLF